MNSLALMGLLVWFLVLGVLAAGLVVFVVACFLRKWKVVKWTIAVTLGTATVVAVAGMALISYIWRPYDPTSEADLNTAYSADFEVPPPPGITVLKARQVIVGDAGGQWLLLKASPEEIERHIAKGFTPARQVPDDFNGHAGANAPSWWTPPTGHLRLYENENWTKSGGWSSSRASMGVDTESGLIWFAASKWD